MFFFISVLWGGFLVEVSELLFLNLSHHPLSSFLFSLNVILLASYYLAQPKTRLPVPALLILNVISLFVALLLCSVMGNVFLLLPRIIIKNSVFLLLIEFILITIVTAPPLFIATEILKRLPFFPALLTGCGIGILITGMVLLRYFSSYTSLFILAIPALPALLFLRHRETEKESIPAETVSGYGFIFPCAFGIILGILYLLFSTMKTLAGLSVFGIISSLAVLFICSGIGLSAGTRLSRRVPFFPSILLSAAGLAIPLVFSAGRALYAQGFFLHPGEFKHPFSFALTPLILCGIPAVCAGMMAPVLSKSFHGKNTITQYIYPLLISISFTVSVIIANLSFPFSFFLNSILLLVIASVLFFLSKSRKTVMKYIPLIPLAMILILTAFPSGQFHLPLIYNSNALSLDLHTSDHIPEAINKKYRLLYRKESSSGQFASLRKRKTLIDHIFFNGELLFHEDFYRDDSTMVFMLPFCMKGGSGNILYGGFSARETLQPLLSYFTGTIVIAEEFPNQTELFMKYEKLESDQMNRFTIISRDIRGFLNTASSEFDVIIHIPPLPLSIKSRGRFSTDFFALAKDHLAEGGLFIQWLPCYKIPPAVFNAVLSTFSNVFAPHTAVWMFDNYIVLAGSNRDMSIDYNEFSKRFSSLVPEPRTFSTCEEVLASFCTSGSRLKQAVDAFPVMHDTTPVFRYSIFKGSIRENLYDNYEFIAALMTDYSVIVKHLPETDSAETFLKGREQYVFSRLNWISNNQQLAEQKIREAIEINSDDRVLKRFKTYMQFRTALGLAKAYHVKFNLDRSLEYFLNAQDIHPLSPPDIAEIGEIYLEYSHQSDWPANYHYAKKAIESISRSIQSHNDFSFAKKTGISALLELNLVERAQNLLRDIQETDPGFPEIKTLEQAIAQKAEDISLEPDSEIEQIVSSACRTLISTQDETMLNNSISKLASAGAEAIPLLMQMFYTTTAEGKKRILHVLGRIGGDPVMNAVRDIMKSVDIAIQVECFDIIRMYGGKDDIGFVGAFVKPEYSAVTRTRAVITLAQMMHKNAIPYLIKSLADTERAVRTEALESLKTVHPMFLDLNIDKPLKKDIMIIKNHFNTINKDEIEWPDFLGE